MIVFSRCDLTFHVGSLSTLNSSECEAFRNDIYRIRQQFDELSTVKIEDAWKDFKDNSIRYINFLEEFAPGILGNDDSVYGLPQELAQEIQDECFFPEDFYVI